VRNHAIATLVKLHDRRLQRRLNNDAVSIHNDDQGLSLIAYALGAAFIVVPIAIALFLFGDATTTRANDDVASLLAASTVTLP
jgi:hypothetical protein